LIRSRVRCARQVTVRVEVPGGRVVEAIGFGGTDMRTLILTLGILSGALALPITHDSGLPVPAIGAVATLDAQTAQPQPPQINVEVNRGGGRWYASPVWMAIGGVALVLVILLIVMAARGGGGGTTVVRG
jgi:hypothetical protein